MYARVLFLVLSAAVVSMAQPLPQLVPVFPSPGLDGVDVSTSIVVRAPSGIDRRSVTQRSPDAELSGWRPTEPTVLLLREKIAQRVPRERWTSHAVVGTMAFDDDRTMRWTPRRLLPNTTYRVIIRNVVIDGGGMGLMCPALEYTFTTARVTPQVLGCTLDSVNVIGCTQPLHVRFSEAILPSMGRSDLVAIREMRDDGSWSTIPCSVDLQDSGRTMRFLPVGTWTPGRPIGAFVELSRATGDEKDDRRSVGTVRGAGSVRLEVRALDGREVPRKIVDAFDGYDRVLGEGATFTLSAPGELDGMWRFVRWEAPDLPSVHRSTDPRLDVSVPCSSYARETIVRAIVEEVDSIRYTVEIDAGGTVDVYDGNGTHLRTVTSEDTIWAHASMGFLTMIATPSANHSFSGWTSGHPGINGSPAATITIPIKPPVGGFGHGTLTPIAYGPRMNPQFTPLNPTRAERYRLVASIVDQDPDPQHDVAAGVTFTTERIFEESSQETRTVCAQASRCWEITGYHDPSSGPPVVFDKGRAELCVSAKLLDPENNLIIFARRRAIDLRLERVLLGSEDPNNIIVGRRPHRESRVDVERRVTVNGKDQWVGVQSVSCSFNGETYERYAFRCGDNVRFVIKNAPRRSESWRWFSAKNRYAQPVLERSTPDGATYTLVIDRDVAQFAGTTCEGQPSGKDEVRLEAAFRQLFGVAEIGLRVRVNARGDRAAARFEERWYDPLLYRDLDADEPLRGRHLEYLARKGTAVKIRFTMPVDGPSVLAGGITASVHDNILITDPHATGLDFATSTGPNGNTNFLPTNGQSADIVEFFICDPTSRPILQALHNGIIDVTCTRSVQSFSGDNLQNAALFVLHRMEIPGFGMRLREASIGYDGDWDLWPFENKGEIYHAIYASDLASNTALLTDQGFARHPHCGQQQGSQGECSVEHSDKDGALSFGDKAVWLQTAWMNESDLAWWTMSTWDEDCKDQNDCLVNRMVDVIRQMKERIESYGSPSSEESIDWATVVSDVIEQGANIIEALLPPDEQDEVLGEATILNGHANLWGMRAPTAPFFEAHHENITYRLRGQWFVSRSVVR
jgi:hypothetical protein